MTSEHDPYDEHTDRVDCGIAHLVRRDYDTGDRMEVTL